MKPFHIFLLTLWLQSSLSEVIQKNVTTPASSRNDKSIGYNDPIDLDFLNDLTASPSTLFEDAHTIDYGDFHVKDFEDIWGLRSENETSLESDDEVKLEGGLRSNWKDKYNGKKTLDKNTIHMIYSLLYPYWGQWRPAIKFECPYLYTKVGDTCLSISCPMDPLGWEEARLFCKLAKGGHLASFNSEKELELARKFVKDVDKTKQCSYWIGASDEASEGSWKWISNKALPIESPGWGKSRTGYKQPDGGSKENYAFLNREDYYHIHDANDWSYEHDKIVPLCQVVPWSYLDNAHTYEHSHSGEHHSGNGAYVTTPDNDNKEHNTQYPEISHTHSHENEHGHGNGHEHGHGHTHNHSDNYLPGTSKHPFPFQDFMNYIVSHYENYKEGDIYHHEKPHHQHGHKDPHNHGYVDAGNNNFNHVHGDADGNYNHGHGDADDNNYNHVHGDADGNNYNHGHGDADDNNYNHGHGDADGNNYNHGHSDANGNTYNHGHGGPDGNNHNHGHKHYGASGDDDDYVKIIEKTHGLSHGDNVHHSFHDIKHGPYSSGGYGGSKSNIPSPGVNSDEIVGSYNKGHSAPNKNPYCCGNNGKIKGPYNDGHLGPNKNPHTGGNSDKSKRPSNNGHAAPNKTPNTGESSGETKEPNTGDNNSEEDQKTDDNTSSRDNVSSKYNSEDKVIVIIHNNPYHVGPREHASRNDTYSVSFDTDEGNNQENDKKDKDKNGNSSNESTDDNKSGESSHTANNKWKPVYSPPGDWIKGPDKIHTGEKDDSEFSYEYRKYPSYHDYIHQNIMNLLKKKRSSKAKGSFIPDTYAQSIHSEDSYTQSSQFHDSHFQGSYPPKENNWSGHTYGGGNYKAPYIQHHGNHDPADYQIDYHHGLIQSYESGHPTEHIKSAGYFLSKHPYGFHTAFVGKLLSKFTEYLNNLELKDSEHNNGNKDTSGYEHQYTTTLSWNIPHYTQTTPPTTLSWNKPHYTPPTPPTTRPTHPYTRTTTRPTRPTHSYTRPTYPTTRPTPPTTPPTPPTTPPTPFTTPPTPPTTPPTPPTTPPTPPTTPPTPPTTPPTPPPTRPTHPYTRSTPWNTHPYTPPPKPWNTPPNTPPPKPWNTYPNTPPPKPWNTYPNTPPPTPWNTSPNTLPSDPWNTSPNTSPPIPWHTIPGTPPPESWNTPPNTPSPTRPTTRPHPYTRSTPWTTPPNTPQTKPWNTPHNTPSPTRPTTRPHPYTRSTPWNTPPNTPPPKPWNTPPNTPPPKPWITHPNTPPPTSWHTPPNTYPHTTKKPWYNTAEPTSSDEIDNTKDKYWSTQYPSKQHDVNPNHSDIYHPGTHPQHQSGDNQGPVAPSGHENNYPQHSSHDKNHHRGHSTAPGNHYQHWGRPTQTGSYQGNIHSQGNVYHHNHGHPHQNNPNHGHPHHNNHKHGHPHPHQNNHNHGNHYERDNLPQHPYDTGSSSENINNYEGDGYDYESGSLGIPSHLRQRIIGLEKKGSFLLDSKLLTTNSSLALNNSKFHNTPVTTQEEIRKLYSGRSAEDHN